MYTLSNPFVLKDVYRIKLEKIVLILIATIINASFSQSHNNASLELQEIAVSGNLFAEDIYKVKSKIHNSWSGFFYFE